MTKLLIVEDDTNLRENTSLDLNMRGYEVLEAADGRGALEIMRSSNPAPDLIISDIAMPDMDGYRFLEHIRANPHWQGIPVLFVTAFDSKNSIQISKELGVDDYIVKPFRMDELNVAIENKLKRIQAFKRLAEQSLDTARRNLLHMISHELRTPLTQVYGGLNVLAEQLADSSDELVTSLLEIINNGSNRLNHLTNKALALIQIDSGHLAATYKQSRRSHAVTEFVMAARSNVDLDAVLARRHVKIVIDQEEDQLYVEGVYEYLVMVIEEVMRNAVAFSPSGGVVTVKIDQNDMFANIIVQDSGPGIGEDQIANVWERFVQTNRDEYEQQGAGLGLAIVKEVVHIHGGYCKIVSSASGGTVVTVSLPLRTDVKDG